MRWLSLLAPAAWLLPSLFAVFADDAFQIDYHIPLLGLPQQHTTFFHQPYAQSKASLLYTLSDKAVLGALNPRDGAIVWRQALAESGNRTNVFLRAGDGQDTVVSAVNNEVAAWSASDGRLVWSRNLGPGVVEDLEIVELPGAKDEKAAKDVLLLYNNGNAVVQRLDGGSGNVKWEHVDRT
jgi:ER membrane protein complex subunit 1